MNGLPRYLPAVVLVATVLGVLSWGEWITWRGSRQALPAAHPHAPSEPRREYVLILGFASDGKHGANAVQRWRSRIAVRSADKETAQFIFSGASKHGGLSEAEVMANYAVEVLGLPEGNVILETQATTTWENIAYSIPLMREADSIKIASNTFHARRGRRYLAMQSPLLADRLLRASDYKLAEFTLGKPLLAIYEWRRSRREQTTN
jgi:uncharacterized SAM-binding protein YcdF (DUF218 family)